MTDEEKTGPIKSIEEWYEKIFEADDNNKETNTQKSSESDTAALLARKSLERLTMRST